MGENLSIKQQKAALKQITGAKVTVDADAKLYQDELDNYFKESGGRAAVKRKEMTDDTKAYLAASGYVFNKESKRWELQETEEDVTVDKMVKSELGEEGEGAKSLKKKKAKKAKAEEVEEEAETEESDEEESEAEEKPKKPKKEKAPRGSVWHPDDYECANFNVGEIIKGAVYKLQGTRVSIWIGTKRIAKVQGGRIYNLVDKSEASVAVTCTKDVRKALKRWADSFEGIEAAPAKPAKAAKAKSETHEKAEKKASKPKKAAKVEEAEEELPDDEDADEEVEKPKKKGKKAKADTKLEEVAEEIPEIEDDEEEDEDFDVEDDVDDDDDDDDDA